MANSVKKEYVKLLNEDFTYNNTNSNETSEILYIDCKKPILKIDNRVVKAAGILFYCQVPAIDCESDDLEPRDQFRKNKNYKFLVLERLVKNKKLMWEDFGGKVEHNDLTVYDTAIRETLEESNNYFEREYLSSCIKNAKYVWNSNCCYCVFLIPLDKEIDPKDLGNIETHTGITRIAKWVSKEELIKSESPLHMRLRSNYLRHILNKL